MNKLIPRIVYAALLACAALAARADYQENKIEVLTQPPGGDQSTSDGASDQETIEIQTLEPSATKKPKHDVAWLGLAALETSAALSSQLGLKCGEGLTVHFLAPNSPAAKADLQEHDVLVEFDDQMLVYPMQLRKLVQMHAEGDSVKIVFYRGGKKQTTTVKLGKTTWNEASNEQGNEGLGKLENLQSELYGLTGQLHGMNETLTRSTLNKAKLDADIKRTMEQTRKAIRDAMQNAASDRKSLFGANRDLESLARHGVDVDPDATVIVRNKHNSNRVVVQTDDSGTYVIEAGAKAHLTARNRTGKLLFDGQIDTPAEREKVPREVWEKVEPIYDQFATPEEEKSNKEASKSGP